jgi:hypothetical protein
MWMYFMYLYRRAIMLKHSSSYSHEVVMPAVLIFFAVGADTPGRRKVYCPRFPKRCSIN